MEMENEMKQEAITPMGHEEWLAARKSGIGSSEIGTILGLNPFESAYQLWRRKKGLDEPQPENTAMRMGHLLEDVVAKVFQGETGLKIDDSTACDFIVRDKECEWMQCSPDRLYATADGGIGILECKTTSRAINGDDLPKHWLCQLQWQLGICGAKEGHLAWLVGGRDFGCRKVLYNDEFFQWLKEEASKFVTEYLQGDKEPQPTNGSETALKYPRHVEGKAKDVDEGVFDAWEELKRVKAEMANLDKRKGELEDALKTAFEDAECITHNGEVLATWKAAKGRVSFDSKRFKEEHPDTYKEYQKEGAPVRVLLLK